MESIGKGRKTMGNERKREPLGSGHLPRIGRSLSRGLCSALIALSLAGCETAAERDAEWRDEASEHCAGVVCPSPTRAAYVNTGKPYWQELCVCAVPTRKPTP